jgi:outer membrane lipoprotein-sorting protein
LKREEGRETPAAPSDWSSAAFLQSLDARQKDIRSLRSIGKLSFQSNEGKWSTKISLLVERPDKIRIEALSMFGAFWVVTYDGSELSHLDVRSLVLRRGDGGKENLRKILRVPLEIDDLTSLLMGILPKGNAGVSEKDLVFNPEVPDAKLTRNSDAGAEERVWFSPSDDVPRKIERDGASGVWLEAEYRGIREASGFFFPKEVILRFPAEEISVRVEYDEPEINPALPPDLFRLKGDKRVREMPLP